MPLEAAVISLEAGLLMAMHTHARPARMIHIHALVAVAGGRCFPDRHKQDNQTTIHSPISTAQSISTHQRTCQWIKSDGQSSGSSMRPILEGMPAQWRGGEVPETVGVLKSKSFRNCKAIHQFSQSCIRVAVFFPHSLCHAVEQLQTGRVQQVARVGVWVESVP
jgi:hypothetical protein